MTRLSALAFKGSLNSISSALGASVSSFIASPSSVSYGSPTTLSWTTTGSVSQTVILPLSTAGTNEAISLANGGLVAGRVTTTINRVRRISAGSWNTAAVTSTGLILLSSDYGTTWTGRASGTGASLYDIASVTISGTSYIVAINWDGTSRSSDGGLSFTYTGGNGGNEIASASSLNRLVIVYPYAYTTRYSNDGGATWTSSLYDNNIYNQHLYFVNWTGSRFFTSTGSGGYGLVSSNGINWSEYDTGMRRGVSEIASANNSSIIIVGGSVQFPNVQNAQYMYTTDGGGSWNDVGFGGTTLSGVAYGNSTYVIVSSAGNIWTSPDGGTLTSRTNPAAGLGLGNVEWTGTQFIIQGSGYVLRSPTGVTWTRYNFNSTSNLNCVANTGSSWIAVGDSGTIASSSDGLNWTYSTQSGNPNFSSVEYGGGNWVAVSNSSNPYFYKSGTALETGLGNKSLNSIAYSGSTWVAVGNSGTIISASGGASSPFANSWSDRNTGNSAALYGVSWLGNQFMAVGNGRISVSSTGTSWSDRTIGIGGIGVLFSAATSGSIIVVVGQGGNILTSTTGADNSWTLRTSNTSSNLRSVSWTGTRFVATAENGKYVTSTDGITWSQPVNSGMNVALLSSKWGTDRLVIVGSSGATMALDNLNWLRREFDIWGSASSNPFTATLVAQPGGTTSSIQISVS